MKRIIFIFLGSFLLFLACGQNEIIGSELSEQFGADGNANMLIDNLKSGLIAGAEELTPDEIAGLKWMREEEKLAGDLYLSFYEAYEMRIFGNINRSEDAHANAVAVLLEVYEIEDPASNEKGVFNNDTLQNLYR